MAGLKQVVLIFIIGWGCSLKAATCSDLLTDQFSKLPPHIQEITGQTPGVAGVNCLNAVLLWHSLVKDVRQVKWRELQKYLTNPKVFRQLRKNQKPKWGDVVVFRLGATDKILHAAIWLDSKFLWQKNDDGSDSPWEIVSSKDVFNFYDELSVEYYSPVQ